MDFFCPFDEDRDTGAAPPFPRSSVQVKSFSSPFFAPSVYPAAECDQRPRHHPLSFGDHVF